MPRIPNPLHSPPTIPDWLPCLEGPPEVSAGSLITVNSAISLVVFKTQGRPPSRHNPPGTLLQRVFSHRDSHTGIDNLAVSLPFGDFLSALTPRTSDRNIHKKWFQLSGFNQDGD